MGGELDEVIIFEAVAQKVMNINGLAVRPSLFGAVHAFPFQGYCVRVSIPVVKLVDGNRPEGDAVSLSSYSSDHPNDPERSWYEVHQICVEVDIPGSLEAPEKLFSVPCNAYDLVGKSQAKKNVELLKKYDEFLPRAFNFWEKIIRWVTQSSNIGTHSIKVNYPSSGRPTYVLRKSDNRPFWRIGAFLTVLGLTCLDQSAWNVVQEALSAEEEPPLWFVYLAEAEHRAWADDLNGSILSCAIACETLVRAMFWLNLGDIENAAIIDLIDRIAVQGIFNHWPKISGIDNSEIKRKVLGDVRRIFELRNKIMHEGRVVSLSGDEINMLLKSTKDFIVSTDKVYRLKKNLPIRAAIVKH